MNFFLYFFMSTMTSVMGYWAFCNLTSYGGRLRNCIISLQVNFLIYVICSTLLAILWFSQGVMISTGGIGNIVVSYLYYCLTMIQWGVLCFIVGGEAFDELINEESSAAVYDQ